MNAVPVHIALLDPQGTIISLNDSWKQFVKANDLQGLEFGVGDNYLEICERVTGENPGTSCASAGGIRAVLQGETRTFSFEYSWRSPAECHWFRLIATPLGEDYRAGVIVMHFNITEAKKAEEQLAWKTALLEAQVDCSLDGILIVDCMGMKVLQSQKTIDLWEIPPDIAADKDDRRQLEWATSRVKNPGTFAAKADHLYAHSDEISRDELHLVNGKWLDRYSAPVRGTDGRNYGRIWIFRDITERKHASDALRHSEELLRLITNLVPHGIFAKDAAGRHIFANPALAGIAGMSIEEILGKTDFDLVADRTEAEAYRADDLAVIQSGSRMFISEEPRTDLSGRRRLLETIKIPFTVGETGEPAVLGVCMDVTERKRAEEALQRQQAEMQVLFDLMPAMLCFKDTQNVFLRVNQRLAEAAGRPIAEIEGKSAAEVFPLEADKYYADDMEVIRTGRAKLGIIEKLQGRDGKENWVQTDKVPVFDNDGKVRGIVVMVQDITQRRLNEEALRYSEGNMAAAQRIAHFGSWELELTNLTDIAANRTRWSDEIFRIAGYEPGSFEPSNAVFFQHVPVEEHAAIHEAMATAIRERGLYSIVHRLIRPDGDERVIHEVAQVYSDEATGRPLKIIGTTHDITDLSRAEQTNAQSLALLRATLDSTADGILTVGLNGQILAYNEIFLKMSRLPPDMLAANNDALAIEGLLDQLKSPEQFLAKVRHLYDHPLEESFDVFDFKDGRVIERYSRPMLVDGRPVGRVWSFRDITERKQTEARVRLLVDSNVQGVIFWNRNGRITGANDAFLRMIGYTREDLEAGSINWMELTPPEFARLDRRCLEEIDARGVGAPYEKEFILKDGKRVPILIGAAAFEENRNEGVGFVLDLTERKKIERQFLRAQRMESIGTLAGGVAHDLNNILSPIMMSIDLLKSISKTPESLEILEAIAASAKRGSDIVRQVLSFARGVEGERVEIQLKHLMEDLRGIIKDTFPKDIRLQFAIPSDQWTILGDATQIYQVLLNLCVNARDAMPDGGKLAIGIENCVFDEHFAAMNAQAKPGRYVQISVTDTGTGIPPSVLDKMFEPFFTTKEQGKGTGLGLSMVTAIVKSHEGIVNVYSEPGNGTTFKIYLPAMDQGSVPVKEESLQDSMPPGNGETILVVDDEASILTITSKTLQASGYRVLTASNGAEAVRIYAKQMNEIAAVITDMMMPVMDGPATIYALMKINPGVKIVAASGLAANGSGNKSLGPGVKHLLRKPYMAETLLKTLRAILEES